MTWLFDVGYKAQKHGVNDARNGLTILSGQTDATLPDFLDKVTKGGQLRKKTDIR